MTIDEAKTVFLNRGYVEVEGGTIYDADKWRESCRVISEWLEQEPRYCDRNICVSNEYNGISCDDCEVTKSGDDYKYIKSISNPTGIEFDIDIDKKVESYKKLLKHPVIKSIMGMDETQEQLDFVQPHKQIPVTLTVSGDLISRQAVEEIINDIRSCISVEGYWAILERLKKLPSVKPQTGHWIMRHRKVNTINYRTGEDVLTGEIHTVKELIRYEIDEPYCACCGKRAEDISQNYCGYCGARMESEQNG